MRALARTFPSNSLHSLTRFRGPTSPDGRFRSYSGWVDTIWTFSLGLTGAGSALWPAGGMAPNARQWLVAALVAIWSLRLGAHIAARSAKISDDPRYAAFAMEWGADSPQKMFIFLQNQGFGS